MAVPDAKRKANNKWDKENMATLGCKVKRDQAERFKECCAMQGKKANAVLRDFVIEYIGDAPATQEVEG